MARIGNVTRVSLILLSMASFFPQIHRIVTRGDCDGISLVYVFFNMILANEQFTIAVLLFGLVDGPNMGMGDPRTLGDWLNLAQFGAAWLGHSTIFLCCLFFPPAQAGWKSFAVVVYFLILSGSLIPAINWFSPPLSDRKYSVGIFTSLHSLFVNPVVAATTIVGFLVQAAESANGTSIGALSIPGLLMQALVTTAAAISWSFRMPSVKDNWPDGKYARTLLAWYEIIGWAVMDDLVFALMQGILYLVALGL